MFFIYFRYYPSVEYRVVENSLPNCRLPFCPIDNVLCFSKLFRFMRSHLSIVALRIMLQSTDPKKLINKESPKKFA